MHVMLLLLIGSLSPTVAPQLVHAIRTTPGNEGVMSVGSGKKAGEEGEGSRVRVALRPQARILGMSRMWPSVVRRRKEHDDQDASFD